MIWYTISVLASFMPINTFTCIIQNSLLVYRKHKFQGSDNFVLDMIENTTEVKSNSAPQGHQITLNRCIMNSWLILLIKAEYSYKIKLCLRIN